MMTARTRILASEGRRLGNLVFMTMGHYSLTRHKPSGDDPADQGTNIDEAIWPRIDSPDTPETARWNSWIEEQVEPKPASSEKKKEETVGAVSQGTTTYLPERDLTVHRENLISVVVNSSWYGGGAHGSENATTYTYLLDKGRELVAADLFDEKAPWLKTVRERSAALLHLQLDTAMNEISDKELEGLVSDVRDWTLGFQGLSIRFAEYSVGPYSSGIPEIVIPWTELSGLKDDAVMPIRG